MGSKPNYTPTEHAIGMVKGLAIAGLSDEEISAHLGIAQATLRKHHKADLKFGRTDVKALGASQLIKAVKEGNVTAIIFFCKTRLGWRETDRLEVTGADGKPIEVRKLDTPELEPLTMEQWQEKLNASRAMLN